ncbi:aminotransferase class III-fold pyridoxal phosphate-dependent enzyme, partial [Mesorhizobium sp. M4B.F.Ca.ET.169.01.1.1]|uniref:aminotransferase class III-fold pyridoxal phosphate-dependent enzyme n=1 Tax=Mesorhizobium sp. M4B.F.Ca.ET.169.01.1.1 TaxID=2563949 RepID=UPI001FE07C1F
DSMVTAKGLSGGLYPISAALVNDKAGGWLNEDGAAHISTTGGAELGCVVGHKVIEMLQRPELVANVGTVTEFMAQDKHAMRARHP